MQNPMLAVHSSLATLVRRHFEQFQNYSIGLRPTVVVAHRKPFAIVESIEGFGIERMIAVEDFQHRRPNLVHGYIEMVRIQIDRNWLWAAVDGMELLEQVGAIQDLNANNINLHSFWDFPYRQNDTFCVRIKKSILGKNLVVNEVVPGGGGGTSFVGGGR